ncbi:pyridoxamine 5'-phosphate oxidase family protein [Corynebacterium sp. HS2168-gen11]|uniref:pyridoxamine 5'-phosphate oxidase family protein n=1 Tax=Corynebacterium sp. HS2168-gen11 TaxID=2974027 RepID=UPI00216B2E65|nr:pyridoxamine 5'-phosphate oxidase family protein [Corynebacterium sp. HS2168-gen11]MCS4535267.1 pyridoxamine 5'-phosphate oxidase family protein [Corynebacterium sp. HS2168-gen11]
MVTMTDDVISVLSREECFAKLATQQLGRLVVRRSNDMDIFPVNYVTDGENIYFRTAEGAKLFTLALNSDVLFEVDEVTESAAWSVVIKGNAVPVKELSEISHADSLPLRPWVPTLKYNYVRIEANEVSGRAFLLGEEPERY